MTAAELTAWGATENDARLADLAEAHAGQITLQEAQARAKRRRRAVGLGMGAAAAAVAAAQVAKKRAEAAPQDVGVTYLASFDAYACDVCGTLVVDNGELRARVITVHAPEVLRTILAHQAACPGPRTTGPQVLRGDPRPLAAAIPGSRPSDRKDGSRL